MWVPPGAGRRGRRKVEFGGAVSPDQKMILFATNADVVICDIFMTGMDGIETITEFHQIDPNVPIIAMSGFMFRDGQVPAPDYLTLSTRLGAAYSLRKPFRPQELLKAVQACIGSTADDPNLKAIG